jgi:hypothetical protein
MQRGDEHQRHQHEQAGRQPAHAGEALRFWLVAANADQQLADVLALEELEQRLGKALEAVDDVFARLQLPCAIQPAISRAASA